MEPEIVSSGVDH